MTLLNKSGSLIERLIDINEYKMGVIFWKFGINHSEGACLALCLGSSSSNHFFEVNAKACYNCLAWYSEPFMQSF